MGNREALLEAAKGCLHERGYAQTSARDLASAAGVSPAAIGYHHGTKDALLTTALTASPQEWSRDLEEILSGKELVQLTRALATHFNTGERSSLP